MNHKFNFDQTVEVTSNKAIGFQFKIDAVWKKNGIFYYSGKNENSGCASGFFSENNLKLVKE